MSIHIQIIALYGDTQGMSSVHRKRKHQISFYLIEFDGTGAHNSNSTSILMESTEIHSERVCRIRISRPSTLFDAGEIDVRELCPSQQIILMPFAQLHFHKAHSPISVLFALAVVHSACVHL